MGIRKPRCSDGIAPPNCLDYKDARGQTMGHSSLDAGGFVLDRASNTIPDRNITYFAPLSLAQCKRKHQINFPSRVRLNGYKPLCIHFGERGRKDEQNKPEEKVKTAFVLINTFPFIYCIIFIDKFLRII